ncbi:hypothetical protein D3C80_1601740 [compost metagenome]
MSFGDQVFIQLEREINTMISLVVHTVRPVLHRYRLTTTGVGREDNEVAAVPATATDFIHSVPASRDWQSSIS